MQLKNWRNQAYSLISLVLLLVIIVSVALVTKFLADVINKSFTTDAATAQSQIIRFNLNEWEQVKNRLPSIAPKNVKDNTVINTVPIAPLPVEENINGNVNLSEENVLP